MGSKITYSSLPQEVKRIANESIGRGVLQSLFKYDTNYHILIKIEDGEIIGFALYHFDEDDLSEGRKYINGVIDCICVSTEHRGQGIGTRLTIGVLRKMSARDVNRIELMIKVPPIDDRDSEPGVPIRASEVLLNDLGFRKINVYENYFHETSLNNIYECIFCDNSPDNCAGILYAINK